MTNSMWAGWLRNLGHRRPVKRSQSAAHRWEAASERLEDRALLSATGLSAQVATEKSTFTAPNVAGTWDITVTGLGDATATFTQHGAKVTSDLNFPGFGTLHSSSKFTKKHPNELDDTLKVVDPETHHKVKATITLTFPSDTATPDTFTGSATVAGNTLQLSGEKQMVMTAAIGKSMHEPTAYPIVAGDWSLAASAAQVNIEGILNLQPGKSSKTFTGSLDESEAGSISLKGKFNKQDPNTAKGTATITIPEVGTFKVKYSITFENDVTTFHGTATSKKTGNIDLTGDRVLA